MAWSATRTSRVLQTKTSTWISQFSVEGLVLLQQKTDIVFFLLSKVLWVLSKYFKKYFFSNWKQLQREKWKIPKGKCVNSYISLSNRVEFTQNQWTGIDWPAISPDSKLHTCQTYKDNAGSWRKLTQLQQLEAAVIKQIRGILVWRHICANMYYLRIACVYFWIFTQSRQRNLRFIAK